METQNPIIIDKFSDVINLNAFIAYRPQRVKMTYKTSQLTGLWQLDLMDLESENLWSVGHYVDGLEGRAVYDVTARRIHRHYVVEGFDGEHVLWMTGGFIFVAPSRQNVLVAPQVCNRTDPLREPVYIWRDSAGLNVLDCGRGLVTFQKRQFEDWVKRFEQTIHWQDYIHWQEWFVIPGVNPNEKWLTAAMRAVRGLAYPTPDEVLKSVELLYP
ncbi:MAG: hypothetical protein ACO2PM_01550 [Pyrobaculum sp.]|jgi:hypothetical protein